METRVRFTYNKRTGQVEEFSVEQEKTLPQQEHDKGHDRIAAEIGRVVERNPRIVETQQTGPSQPRQSSKGDTSGETARRPERDKSV